MPESVLPSISIRKTTLPAAPPRHAACATATIGVSKDSAASHGKFAAKHSLPFTLIADTDTTLNQAFGVWQKKKMAGREYMGTVRTTFLVDGDGTVTDIIAKVDTKNSASQILEIINKKA